MIDLEKLNKEKYNGRGVIKRAGHVSDCNVIDVSKTDELTTDGFLAKDVSTGAVGNYGDTGTSVLNALINNNMKLIKLKINDFIVHYASGSHDKHKSNNAMHWLHHYRVLWE